jgi:hypothetical protein
MLHDRRRILGLLAGPWALPAVGQTPLAAAGAQAGSPEISRPTAYAFSFKRLEGGDLRLAEHACKPSWSSTRRSLRPPLNAKDYTSCGYAFAATGGW